MSRRLLHGRVARALELRQSKLPATLGHIGYHYSKAGNAPAAVRYLMRFADLAFRDHGVNEALVALEQAFVDAEHLPEAERDRSLVEIVTRQSYCFISLGRFVDLIARMRTLAPTLLKLDSSELAGPFHFFWGFALALTAERREAGSHAQGALEHALRCDDKRGVGFAHALLSYLCQMTGRFQEGVAHGLLATELLDAHGQAREAATIAWLCLGLNRLWLGDVQAALDAVDRAATIAHDADNMRGQALAATTRGLVYAYTDQWELAVETTQRGLKASRDPFTFVSALWMTAYAQSGDGQTAQAIELLNQVITQLDQHGMRAWCGHAIFILADAHLRSGDAACALARADEALGIAQATDDRICVGWATRARGQALAALGQHDAARDAYAQALELFEELGARMDSAKTLVERAQLELSAQRAEHALHALQRADEFFEACGVRAALVRTAQLRVLRQARASMTHVLAPPRSTGPRDRAVDRAASAALLRP